MSVTCTNEHGDAMHQVFGAVDDSGSIMIPWPENVPPTLPEVSTEEDEAMSVVLSLLPVYRMDSPSFCLTVLEVAPAPDLLQELGEIPGLNALRRVGLRSAHSFYRGRRHGDSGDGLRGRRLGWEVGYGGRRGSCR